MKPIFQYTSLVAAGLVIVRGLYLIWQHLSRSGLQGHYAPLGAFMDYLVHFGLIAALGLGLGILAICIITVGSSGCKMVAGEYRYRVVLVNLSTSTIPKSQVLDGTDTFRYGGGILIPSGYSAHAGPMETPPNDVFILRWHDDQNREHELTFDLRKRVKPSFKGEIVFVYGADKTFTVEVVNPPARYPIPPQRPQ